MILAIDIGNKMGLCYKFKDNYIKDSFNLKNKKSPYWDFIDDVIIKLLQLLRYLVKKTSAKEIVVERVDNFGYYSNGKMLTNSKTAISFTAKRIAIKTFCHLNSIKYSEIHNRYVSKKRKELNIEKTDENDAYCLLLLKENEK